MNFQEALKKSKQLEEQKLNSLKTLGGIKPLTFKSKENTITIINSKNKSYEIKKEHWEKIIKRYNEVPDNFKTQAKQYTFTVWKENNPSTVFSPYVVALLRYLDKLDDDENINCEKLFKSYSFYKIGHYQLIDNELKRCVEKNVKVSERKSLVYMLCVNNKCKYIGKTIQGYSRPLNYHKNKVMNTVYNGIKNEVNNGNLVIAYALDEGLAIDYLDLKLNIVEAVEQALISKCDPDWNNFKQ